MKLFLRYGSHSEKTYFEKVLRFFDGVIFQASLLESTPAAVVGLIARFSGGEISTPFMIDPMTYSFGALYGGAGKVFTDLHWLTSASKGGKRSIKSSYTKLAKALGDQFQAAVDSRRSISLENLNDAAIRKSICEAVINYQKNRVSSLLQEEKEFAPFTDDFPKPAIVFAPYFSIDPSNAMKCLDTIDSIVADSMSYEREALHVKFCFDKSSLMDKDFVNRIFSICDKNFKGVWLWIDEFDETTASSEQLIALGALVKGLSKRNKEVYNRHGGFYSVTLSKLGMTGVSSGVGYGEYKSIVPVSVGGFPPVNYYIPGLHKKFSATDVEDSFEDMGIETSKDFFEKICGCVVCKGVIGDRLSNFRNFGTRHLATPTSKKQTQTHASASRARFHYLLCRVVERNHVAKSDLKQIVEALRSESLPFSELVLFESRVTHIQKWIESLSNK